MTGVGLISGLFNGAASLGGLPVAIFLMGAALAAAALRATMNLYFLLISFYSAAAMSGGGILDGLAVSRAACLALPVALGIFIGHHGFHRAAPETFRRAVLGLLAVLSCAGLVRALL